MGIVNFNKNCPLGQFLDVNLYTYHISVTVRRWNLKKIYDVF